MKGLKLFVADIIDEDTSEQYYWYVVGKTYDSAFNRFIKEANACWNRYLYYFNEATDDDVEEFLELCEVKAGIYEK